MFLHFFKEICKKQLTNPKDHVIIAMSKSVNDSHGGIAQLVRVLA